MLLLISIWGEENMKQIAIAMFLLFAATSVMSQQPSAPSQPTSASSPVVSVVLQMEGRFSKNLIGAADEMPAAKYDYRPTPEQITFAHLMVHIAEANNSLCAFIGGQTPSSSKLSDTGSKETLVQAVKDSFSYCEQILAKADDSNLGQAVALPGGQTSTRAALLVRLPVGWADHYSAAAMYLRLNNLLPPSASKEKH
jgi:DinB superfamily